MTRFKGTFIRASTGSNTGHKRETFFPFKVRFDRTEKTIEEVCEECETKTFCQKLEMNVEVSFLQHWTQG